MASDSSPQMQEHQIYNRAREIPFLSNRHIGSGGFGVVDEVEGIAGPFENQIYARKVIILVDNEADRKKQLEGIKQEVEILRKAQHAHVVQLIMTYEFFNNFGIVMDPCADGDLEKAFQENTCDDMSRWFKCLLNGVAYVHKKGITHRDIKPQNILVKDGEVYLSDFGLSKMGLGMTHPTTNIGQPRGRTPEYCAPEVELGHTRNRKADIFSLGAVYLEMLTVCSYPYPSTAKLAEFRSLLRAGDRQSYALGVSRLNNWMDRLGDAPSKPAWHSAILSACRKMLMEDRGQRPTADDVQFWWQCYSSSDLPPAACHCNATQDFLDPNQGTSEDHADM